MWVGQIRTEAQTWALQAVQIDGQVGSVWQQGILGPKYPPSATAGGTFMKSGLLTKEWDNLETQP